VKLVHTKALPRTWARHPKARGLVAEADISPHGHGGRLRAKLLVFETPQLLARFCSAALGSDQLIANRKGQLALGAVNPLSFEMRRFADGLEQVRLHADPRYFCLIGLTLGNLSMEIISHEAVHAGFCYEKRVKRNVFGDAAAFDEERIAYPAGAIAAGINRFLDKAGLYERGARA
jgi:hypothetical protein